MMGNNCVALSASVLFGHVLMVFGLSCIPCGMKRVSRLAVGLRRIGMIFPGRFHVGKQCGQIRLLGCPIGRGSQMFGVFCGGPFRKEKHFPSCVSR